MMDVKNSIYDIITHKKVLTEMAIINPKLCKTLSIQVEVEQSNEGPIPHMHIYLGDRRTKRNCVYVRLDKAEYSKHHKSKSVFNRKQKEEFINIMSSVWNGEYIKSIKDESVKEATGYEAAVKIWIDTFGETVNFNYDKNGFPLMPDYTQL